LAGAGEPPKSLRPSNFTVVAVCPYGLISPLSYFCRSLDHSAGGACGSGVVRVQAEGLWHTDIDRRSWSGNFERGEIVSPLGCIASKVSGLDLAMPDTRHRRPLKVFYTVEV
jgi:hypothetical protein